MLLPIKWMKNYVDIDDDVKSLADKLTNSGSHVESIDFMGDRISGVIVARIERIEKHPNADRLVVMKVNTGKEIKDIITAAKNVYEGAYVALAQEGAILADGSKIKATDFKGIKSYGMLCSYQELGFPDNVINKEFRDGVLIFREDMELGLDVREVLYMDEPVIDFEITPNRSDCLSIIGMAREAAATYDKKIKLPDLNYETEEESIGDHVKSIKIETDNCIRYIGRVLTDVKIGPSPLWMQNSLMQAGMRPINNIVDITNYVMLEYGQPLHAFDADTLSGKKIIVRQAEEGESLETLDKQDRILDPDMMVIADEDGPIGLAGVMGGFSTEITENTKNILIEAACFDQDSIRRTSKRLNLRSEASSRYEKGLAPEITEAASLRACQLAEQIGAAKVLKGSIDQGKKKSDEKVIDLRPARCNSLLGTDLKKKEIIDYLIRLEFKVEDEGDILRVQVPFFRLDISYECDLIEEVARLYGLENIEAQPLKGPVTKGDKTDLRLLTDQVKEYMYGMGMTENATYSFISKKIYDDLEIEEDSPLRNYLTILNPLGEDFSVMRTSLVGNMLNTISKNASHREDYMRFYEVGNCFLPKEGEELPDEVKLLCVGFYGDCDFYDIKANLTALMDQLGLKGRYEFKADRDSVSFHPGRCAKIFLDENELGIIGQISYKVQDNFDIKGETYIYEIKLDDLLGKASREKKFIPYSKYPSVVRDIAFVLDQDLESKDIIRTIKDFGGPLIKRVSLFDIYQDKSLGDNKKSLAYQLVYQSDDRTLKDEEINESLENIIEGLKKEFNVELRS